MKLSLDSLKTTHARKMFLLMYACRKKLVPESLLGILLDRIKTSNCSFFYYRNELITRELLKLALHAKAMDQDDVGSKAWSLGCLVKHYIKDRVTIKAKLR